MLIDIEQNIANIERNLTQTKLKHANSVGTPEKPSMSADRKRSSTLKSVRSLIRFGKQRPPKDSDNEEEVSLIQDSARTSRQVSESESAPISRAGSQSSVSSREDNQEVALVEKRKATK